jgi:hypothetical protein
MKIELVNVQNMQTGMHVKVLADSKEVGVLYLNNEVSPGHHVKSELLQLFQNAKIQWI